SAPARAACAMLSALMPPSTSSQMSLRVASMRRRASAILGSTEAMNCWPPNPGFTDMISTRSSPSRVWSRQLSGVAGLRTRPGLQPCSRIRAMVRSTCSEASGWKLMMLAPALANAGTRPSTGFTIRCTSSGSSTCGRSAAHTSAATQYLPEQSDEASGRYVFAYTITLRNAGSVAAQLISRHWIITDAQGLVQEVRGLGVVGAQPLLQPGESFEYTSGASIATPV